MKIRNIIFSLAGAIVRIAILILAIYFVIEAGKKAYDFGFRIFTEEPMAKPPGREVTVTVSSGDSEGDIATMLQEKGLIRDAILFRIQKKLSTYKNKIGPGTYKLNTCMTTDEMLEIMVGSDDSDSKSDDDSGELEADEGVDTINPATDDITGLESGGVLAEEEESYDEATAYEADVIEVIEDPDNYNGDAGTESDADLIENTEE